MKPKGLLTITGITLADGTPLSTQQAVDYGWICPPDGRQPAGWALERHEVPVGKNLFLDSGRQLMAYAFGFRAPVENYVCRRFGVGTGTSAPRVTDVVLESPVTLASGQTTALIDSVDFLTAFVVRVSFTLGINDANGYAISELGLFSGNNTLIARKVRTTVINKSSEFSPSFLWRLRF